MGTFVQVKAMSRDMNQDDICEAVEGAFTLAREIESKVSVYDAESELNNLNFSGKMKVSLDVLDVLIVAKKINDLTSGAFDPTIAPILKRNGFYGGMPLEVLERIPEGDGGVGFHNVWINTESGVVSLDNGAWLDLSGLVKGYIVDRMASFLKEKGVKIFLVNAGGDIYCAKGPSGKKWRVGIREPGTEEITAVLEIENYAVATSGDYENVIVDGEHRKIISHIADPSLLMTTEMTPLGFTVIGPDCVTADGLATGMTVMGHENALKTAEGIAGVEVIAVISPENEDAVFMSSGADKYISVR